jgi:sulfite reductase (NADPH) hemoprotein beta-component
VVNAIDTILKVYVEQRQDSERFLDTYRRIGLEPFKSQVYASGEAEELA